MPLQGVWAMLVPQAPLIIGLQLFAINHSPLNHCPINHYTIQSFPLNHYTINRSPLNHYTINHSPINRSQSIIHNQSFPINHSPINRSPINRSPINRSPINRSPINRYTINHYTINHSPINRSPINRSPPNHCPLMITFAAQFFYCGNINHYLVKADDFLSLYSEDSMVKMLANEIMLPSPSVIHLKGLRGCLDTLLAASMQKLTQKSHLFVLQDKEEAFFFLHNLESLLGKGRLLFFPVSYRKPYEYEEVDNANVLQRAETLTELAKERSMIVTYPEALGEKVITRKSLSSHTFRVKKGETADRAFLEEFL